MRHRHNAPIPSAPIIAALLALGISPAQAQHSHAHQHGVAKLNVSVDAPRLTVDLESPMENLVGFERAPRNDRERESLRAMEKQLADTAKLFVPNAEAACRPEPAKISAPAFDTPKGKGAAHADIEVSYTFRCDNIAALRELDVKFFDAFKRLRRIEASIAGQKKQSAATLTPTARKLPL
jgi:hypothetical protein